MKSGDAKPRPKAKAMVDGLPNVVLFCAPFFRGMDIVSKELYTYRCIPLWGE